MYKYIFLLFAVIASFFSCNSKKSGKPDVSSNEAVKTNDMDIKDENGMYLIVGTYTTGDSKGIYIYRFDTIVGNSDYKTMTEVINPSYLAVAQNEKFIYAVSETNDSTASVNAFAFDKKNASLSLLNSQLTGGADPCYVTVDSQNKHVITANYSGGNISVFDVKADGGLTDIKQLISFSGKGSDLDRQTKPHLHCVRYSPDEQFLFADDLGTDHIYKFKINNSGNYLEKGEPASFKVAAGSGPRHLEFHPNSKFAYLINELSGTVIAFDYDNRTGNLKQIQSIQADTLNARGSGDIHITPNGKFLYASNRLNGDGLAIFSIDKTSGLLTKVGYQETGIHPRNFVITPNGKFLLVACRDSNVIQVFKIDNDSGLLENTNKDIKLDKPVCLKFASFSEK